MHTLMLGETDGRKWLAGTVPLRVDCPLEIDTRSGKGVREVIEALQDFVSFQATKIFLPSYSTEDLQQEMVVMAISAIPDYDPTKGANLLTFLQRHLHNRLINLYKYATEQRRTATHDNYRFCKSKCPECQQVFVFDSMKAGSQFCKICGAYPGDSDKKWRKYPLPVPVVSSNEGLDLPDGSYIALQDCFSYEAIPWSTGFDGVDEAFLSIETELGTDENEAVGVVRFLEGGFTMADIVREAGIPVSRVRKIVQKLKESKYLTELMQGRNKE